MKWLRLKTDQSISILEELMKEPRVKVYMPTYPDHKPKTDWVYGNGN
jgi:hypothetical protein